MVFLTELDQSLALSPTCCVTLGKALIVLSFGIFIYEEVAVTTHCISARVIGGNITSRLSIQA